MPTSAPISLLGETVISASGAAAAATGLARYKGFVGSMTLSAKPAGGASTLDVYVQASPDGGTTWRDVVHYQFTTVLTTRVFQLSQVSAGSTGTLAASDAALAGDTVVQGAFGDQLRVKYVMALNGDTGTFTLAVSGTPVGHD